MIANLVAGYGGRSCLDARIAGLCKQHKAQNKRWVDNIDMSGPAYIKKLEPTVERIIKQSGFVPNKEKTNFSSRDEAQIVTGHLVNVKANVKKSERRKLRAILHKCKTQGPQSCTDESIEKFRQRLRGKINHVKSINPKLGIKFLREFNSIEWPT